MNQLIIVGNGFDRSLGLKTDYASFISHLFRKELELFEISIRNTEPHPNLLWSKHFNIYSVKNNYYDSFLKNGNLNQYIGNILPENIFSRPFNSINPIIKENDINKRNNHLKYYTSISSFISDLIIKHEPLDWVKIEEKYFQKLYEFSNKRDRETGILLEKSIRTRLVQSLNEELEILTKELKEYLLHIEDNNETHKLLGSERIGWFKNICKGDVFNLSNKFLPSTEFRKDQIFYSSLMINFNYTKFAPELLNITKINDDKTINIHGDLTDKTEMIFGFGHRPLDAKYQELLDLDIEGSLDHLKMFKYVKNKFVEGTNTNELDQFIIKDNFSVTIIGHSCGISDANLLEEILQHRNCRAINICYKDEIAWQRTAAQVRMRLENDKDFREKVMPMNPNLKILQNSN